MPFSPGLSTGNPTTDAVNGTTTYFMGSKDCPPAIHGGYIATTVLVAIVFTTFVCTAAGAGYMFVQLRAGALPLHDSILRGVFGFDLFAGSLLVIAIGVYTDSANRFLVSCFKLGESSASLQPECNFSGSADVCLIIQLQGYGTTSQGTTDDYYYVSTDVQFKWAGGFVCAILAIVGLCAQPWLMLVLRVRQRRLFDPVGAAEDYDDFAYEAYAEAAVAEGSRRGGSAPVFLDYEGAAEEGSHAVAAHPRARAQIAALPAEHPPAPPSPPPDPEDRQAAYANKLF